MGVAHAGKVVIKRGEIWWAEVPTPQGSEPGYRRPVLIVQSDAYNQTSIETVIVATLTTNLRLGTAPGNVILQRRETRLKSDSVVNVSQLLAVSKRLLSARVGRLSRALMEDVEAGLRRVLSL